LFHQLQYIFAGGFIAGTGVVLMHYIGMMGLSRNGFRIQWDAGWVSVSCVLAVVVATTGYWIVFRFLQWRPELERLRFLASLAIAGAVCSAHYTGTVGATYYSAKTSLDTSGSVVLSYLVHLSAIITHVLVLLVEMYIIIHDRKSTKHDTNLMLQELRETLIQILDENDTAEAIRYSIQTSLLRGPLRATTEITNTQFGSTVVIPASRVSFDSNQKSPVSPRSPNSASSRTSNFGMSGWQHLSSIPNDTASSLVISEGDDADMAPTNI